MMTKAIEACINQIKLSVEAKKLFKKDWGKDSGLPFHSGYTQLAIIYDKQGKFLEAIQVCEQAKTQGWNGDWEKRITRYDKKD